jgi:hypothetical protein
MRKGSSPTNAAILAKLKSMSALIDETVELLSSTQPAKVASKRVAKSNNPGTLDFTVPIRPFIKKHGRGMSGAKKFVLLVAHLTGGDVTKTASLDDIVGQWNRMTAKTLLGLKFNRFYTAAAKENDWVATGKNGLYHLRPSWKEILREER